MSRVVIFFLIFSPAFGYTYKYRYRHVCSVFDDIPNMLKDLRKSFENIRHVFQSKDNLSNSLLGGGCILDDIKGHSGCNVASEMFQFYLDQVLPRAEDIEPNIAMHVISLGEKLHALRLQLRRCKELLPCERSIKSLEDLKLTYNQLHDKGTYKAMSEFDIFTQYLEIYISSRNNI